MIHGVELLVWSAIAGLTLVTLASTIGAAFPARGCATPSTSVVKAELADSLAVLASGSTVDEQGGAGGVHRGE